MKKKRILAWICILFLVGMYVTDFVLALIGSDLARNMLMASCICTILIPIVLYGVVTAFGGRGRGPEIPIWGRLPADVLEALHWDNLFGGVLEVLLWDNLSGDILYTLL